MSYSSVWLIVIAAGCVATIGVYRLTRSIGSGYLRALVCGLVLALLVTPAPVPGHPQNYAPAFIVAVFEGVLQTGGSPGVAVRLLIAVMVAMTVLSFGALALRRAKPSPRPEE